MSSTQASRVWVPCAAVQLLLPAGLPLALTVALWPGARGPLRWSDQVTRAPSTLKRTPMIVPAGVGPLPVFLTVALKTTASPACGAAGCQLIFVTTRSQAPPPGGGGGGGASAVAPRSTAAPASACGAGVAQAAVSCLHAAVPLFSGLPQTRSTSRQNSSVNGLSLSMESSSSGLCNAPSSRCGSSPPQAASSSAAAQAARIDACVGGDARGREILIMRLLLCLAGRGSGAARGCPSPEPLARAEKQGACQSKLPLVVAANCRGFMRSAPGSAGASGRTWGLGSVAVDKGRP